jgi:DNA-binding response OmpR family regulator
MRLLFAEDDQDLSRAVSTLLEHAGYSVDPVFSGTDALDYAQAGSYDGIILDWMMPGLSGIEVLEHIRRQGNTTPCLILTARDAVPDRIAGLNAGADDYLPKPFDTGELMARIRAMLRRNTGFTPDTVRFSDLSLDRSGMELRCQDRSVRLSSKAFQLMELLMVQPHTVHSISSIMDQVWGWDSEAEVSVVWVNISSLRRKIEELGAHVEIRVSRGIGYSLEERL